MKPFVNNMKMKAIKPNDDWKWPQAELKYWFSRKLYALPH